MASGEMKLLLEVDGFDMEVHLYDHELSCASTYLHQMPPVLFPGMLAHPCYTQTP